MFSIGLGLRLRPGCYDRYKKAHDECWPELLETMRENDVNMVIYRSGDQLFVHATAPSQTDWLNSRVGPRQDEWNDFMTDLLETDAEGNILFEELEVAFSFGQFKFK